MNGKQHDTWGELHAPGGTSITLNRLGRERDGEHIED